MKTEIFIDILPPIPYLAEYWFLSCWPKSCWSIKLQDSLKCNLKKAMNDNVYFWHTDKHLSFLQVDTIMLGCVARHTQSTQNNKFAVSLQYLMKEVSAGVDFLHAGKHESFLQINVMIFDGDGQAFLKLKEQVGNVFTIFEKRS